MSLRMESMGGGSGYYRLIFEEPTGPHTVDVTVRYCPSLEAAIREIRFHMGDRKPRRKRRAA